ncbi:MAG: DNA polymerase/3'-5' exonuclease PolX [Ignavibacteria bacterium]|nr:DNA polymerase/3'-5' exonuclease PolX [Ignavibacteria bacterium]
MQLKDALDILEEITFYLELKGENVFKINAFNSAIRNLSRFDVSLQEAFDKGIIQNTKGVGKTIQGILNEILEKNESSLLNELRAEFPAEIYSLTKIRGLGAKKIKKLYDELNITSIQELEQACIENKLLKIPGFGEKTQSSILENINKLKTTKGKLLLHHADSIYEEIAKEIKKSYKGEFSSTGNLRLRSRIIPKIEILIIKDSNNKKLIDSFSCDELEKNIYGGTYKDASVNFVFVDEDNFYLELFKTTGPEHFLKRVNLNELKASAFKSEVEIFEKLNLPYIPPQARENKDLELKNYDFPNLRDLKGLIHIHSNYSDGSNSIKEVLEYAEKKNYEYVLLCDHSKSAFYANGLDEIRLREQWKEIDELNSKSKKVKILKGIECDILPDGSLDFDDSILKQFDCVIASVHSKFKMTEAEMTKRISIALKNKYVKILGHPTGRLLLSRDPYPVDLNEIINVAANEGKSIELNCNPHRLDLDWEYHQKAISKGIKITISPDAHSFEDMEYVRYGIDMAIKGGLEKKDIVNCLSLNQFLKDFCQK